MKYVSLDQLHKGEAPPLTGEVSLHGDSGLETLLKNALNDAIEPLSGERPILDVQVRYPEGRAGVEATAKLNNSTRAFRLHYARPGYWEWTYPAP